MSTNKQAAKAQKMPMPKSKALESLHSYQRLIGSALVASALFGAYLLSTDRSLWILAISHAYGLIAICIIDACLAVANFASVRKVLLPSAVWAVLTAILQLGDILTAPQYKMTPLYFASYLFGLWAFDALVASQVVIVVLALYSRRFAKVLAPKKRVTFFDMGPKNSRRDFLQIVGTIIGLLALTAILGTIDAITGSNSGNSNSASTQSSSNNTNQLPSGAVANVKDLGVGQPVYFSYPSQGYPSMLFKKSDGSLAALSLLCTHACCQCNYDAGIGEFYCPCHGSLFDQEGKVIRGPAYLPLPSIELRVDSGGNIFPVKFNGSSPCLGFA